ncbi:MAG TPA: Phenylacetic acid catabolic protein [Candidatus Dormibacteraeota bacterium]|nr:Phenylacetic acid catabolic protein [Candidatus Dormibacteraeota bacterium]
MGRIATFDEWIDLLHEWQKEIGLDMILVDRYLPGYKLEEKFAELPTREITFGDFAGDRKWERLTQIPDQRIRDTLLSMIIFQGDTEFASNEQQRFLVHNAPSEYDLAALVRIMMEETRHGYQMCYLLVKHFGEDGKIEAQKMLERRAFGQKNRLLNAFNNDVTHWMDFFAYTNFMDRDGKYQLTMLSHSGFAPLASSTRAMLQEESFHMGTGITGLKRIAAAGVIPVLLQQKYYNKWISGSLDLFGTDRSSSASWAYAYGIKGRPDEDKTEDPVDREHLNERARDLYYEEVSRTVDMVNQVAQGEKPLYVPDIRFNRQIGDFKGQRWSVDGRPLSEEEYAAHLREVLPTDEDERILAELFKNPEWILPKGRIAPTNA